LSSGNFAYTFLERFDLKEVFMNNSKLYIGNLSFSVTNESLSQAFAKCGTVSSAKVITDRDTGRSKGFGFVEMSCSDEGTRAISEMNGTNLDGREINVNQAKPMAPREGGNSWGNR
jgi:cold-inducible RNA-binding protein